MFPRHRFEVKDLLRPLLRQQQDGSKGVKVGTRIAVLAESDDDLSTLELPAEEPSPQASPQKDLKSGVDPSIPSESHAEAPSISKGEDASPANPSELSSSSPSSNSKPQKQTYPLYPSIAQLLHEKGLPTSEAEKIPASGPKGRLLKGDVLAYLGTIKQSYSSDQSARISKLGHLDLSNVKAAPPKESTSPPSKAPSPMAAESEPDTEIAIPISLSSVLSVQKRIQGTLGVTLPLSTFIARATELANDELPRSATSKPSADELFNDVLGLHNISAASSQGHFIPQITALPSRPMTERPAGPSRQPDVYDILTGHASATSRSKRIAMPPPGIMAGSKPGESTNVFSVSAAKGEEKRARVFLERVKTILQVEPGRLIL